MTEPCYICGRHTEAMEEHHIIPQASGGASGPTVWLCSNDHTLVHKQALNIVSKQPTRSFFPPEQESRAMNVVRFIVAAIRRERESPDFSNPYTLHIKTTKGVAYMLHLLKAEAGYTNLHTFVIAILMQVIRSRFGAVRTNQERPRRGSDSSRG